MIPLEEIIEIAVHFQLIALCHREGLSEVSLLRAELVIHLQISTLSPSTRKTQLRAVDLMLKAIRQLM